MPKRLIIIGDLQGCFEDFLQLLDKLHFNSKKDTLWLAGDIVNRGPQSLACLRYAKKNQTFCKIVLGNHDLHLIAASHKIRKPHKRDTIQEILDAPDSDELINWLRHQPLMRYHKKENLVMSHAGIYPCWSIKKAKKLAKQAEAVLQSDNYLDFINVMYGNAPERWPTKGEKKLQGVDRTRFIINSFTRMRYVDHKLNLDMTENGPVGTQSPYLAQWFDHPSNKLKKTKVIFGHWSTVTIHKPDQFYPLDTGCVWGGTLTALVVQKKSPYQFVSTDCAGALKPND